MRKHNRRWRRRVDRMGFLVTGKRTPKELPGISGDGLVRETMFNSSYHSPETRLVEDYLRRGGLRPEGRAATIENIQYALSLFR